MAELQKEYKPWERDKAKRGIEVGRWGRRLLVAGLLGIGGMAAVAGKDPGAFEKYTREFGGTLNDFAQKIKDSASNLASGQFAKDASAVMGDGAGNLSEQGKIIAVGGTVAGVGGFLMHRNLTQREEKDKADIDSRVKV